MRELTEAAPGVFVATAELYTTTSTVIADGHGGCLVVDPAVTVSEVDELAAAIEALGLRPVAGWCTHPHWDHLLWSARLGDVPRYSSAAAAKAAERERAELTESVCAEAPGHDLEIFGRVMPVSDDVPEWRGPPVQVLAHEGHKTGHTALLLPEAGVLIAGDMLSDIEIPLLDLDGPDPAGHYQAGLELLAAAADVRLIVPGHGHIGDRAEYLRRVRADLYYVSALKHGDQAAGRDQRIGESWLRAEHDRQFARLHA
jgi:glyoxylase-like metal-dependent hydrolase (beta-lactamase superfamily II)